MSGACFKGISNSETLTLSVLKHRLLCKWCLTAAKKRAPFKVPSANYSKGVDREVERQTFPSNSHDSRCICDTDQIIQTLVG